MDDNRQQAFMTTLVTEHFALQGARAQTTSWRNRCPTVDA
jgi:hypothetical protein